MMYAWKGLKNNTFSEGEVEAESKEAAIFELKKDGTIVTTIDDDAPEKELEGKIKKVLKGGVKIKDKELLLFTKKLTTMDALLEALQSQNFNGRNHSGQSFYPALNHKNSG